MKRFDLSLYLVLDPGLCRQHTIVETARMAVASGATMVQLRDKNADPAGLIAIGRALMAALAGTGVPLIINDDVIAAVAIGADGVHVGQDDMPVNEVRQRIGSGKILGLSAVTEADVRAADPAVVDYLGIGPIFSTPTKADHKPPMGFDGLARLVHLSSIPSVAIGGLKVDHVSAVLSAGADGLAVVSAICGQPDPEAATRGLAHTIRDHRNAGP